MSDTASEQLREAIAHANQDVAVMMSRGDWAHVCDALYREEKRRRGISRRSRWTLTKQNEDRVANKMAHAVHVIQLARFADQDV